MKVTAAMAAMLLVSGTSVGMYKLIDELGTAVPEYSISGDTAEAATDSAAQNTETASKTASAQITNMSWVELASPADALTVPEIVEKAMPSAVGISSTFTYTAQTAGYAGFGFDGMRGNAQPVTQEATASGSGIVMSSDGYIITNAHVIYDTESEYNISNAAEIIRSLITNGYVTGRPMLGISGTTITEETAALYHLPQGVYVYSASDHSLQQGDVITAIDGTAVTTMEELNTQKNLHKAGETVTLRIIRDGESADVQITLQESKPEE